MRAMWHRRQDIADQAARCAASPKATSRTMRLRSRCTRSPSTFTGKHTDKHFGFYVHYDAIDDAFRPAWCETSCPLPSRACIQNQGATHEIVGRREARDVVRALGADGEDRLLRRCCRALRARGSGGVLARLAIDYDTVVHSSPAGAGLCHPILARRLHRGRDFGPWPDRQTRRVPRMV